MKKLNVEKNDYGYYSLSRILQEKAQYNVIFGERSNGKSFSVEELGLDNYIEKGQQMAIFRRNDVSFEARNSSTTFQHFVNNKKRGNIIKEKTNGQWEDVTWFRGAWYLSKRDDKGKLIRDFNAFCYAFALSTWENYKSTSYPRITTILFDEFLTRGAYLTDEFVLFQNMLSTIIRDRDDVTVFMCGNTVNMFSPYFKEMGLDNIHKMKPGDIQVYKFATMHKDETLTIAVEFADMPSSEGKASDKYFAFGNPRLKMITTGMWELAIYPHLPYRYTSDDILDVFFIKWEQYTLQCEIIEVDTGNNAIPFIYVHEKTTPMKDEDNDLIFSTSYDPRMNWRRKITAPMDDIGRKIKFFFDHDKVYYQDNTVGEIVRNYIQWCKTDRGIQ